MNGNAMMIKNIQFCLAFAVAISACQTALSTIPKRNTVQLTIYNSEDITLVRETRVVTFKKGNNPLQFSWANTLIDPSSVDLKFLTSADKLDVEDTTFPHDKPQMLYWNVKSNIDGFVRVTNNSGEEYENAQVRLVVGTINLVEKIAELARVPMSKVRELGDESLGRFRRESALKAMDKVAI